MHFLKKMYEQPVSPREGAQCHRSLGERTSKPHGGGRRDPHHSRAVRAPSWQSESARSYCSKESEVVQPLFEMTRQSLQLLNTGRP